MSDAVTDPQAEFDHAGALRKLAEAIYARTPDLASANTAMEAEVWEDEHLFGPITARAVKEAVRLELLAVQRDSLRVPRAPRMPAVAAPARPDIQAWGGAVQSGLMATFKLQSGVILGDATRADLSAAMNGYEVASTDAKVKSRWMRLILQGLPAGKRVRQHYSEARISELRQAARSA